MSKSIAETGTKGVAHVALGDEKAESGWVASNARCRRVRENGLLTARLTHYGALVFSLSAIRKFGLADARLCRLHFDRSRLMVGIELVPADTVRSGKDERNVYTTPRSAHILMTSILRAYDIEAAADTVCPVVSERHENINLIAVDLTPAVEAAARGGVIMPFRPGAGDWLRYKPNSARTTTSAPP